MSEEDHSVEVPDNKSDFDYDIAMGQLHQKIYSNWKHNQGPCRDCPIRFKRKQCHPKLNIGDPTAELMFVFRSPGVTNDDIRAENSNEERVIDPTKLVSADEFTSKNLYESYGYAQAGLKDYADDVRRHLFESSFGLEESIDDIYITNSTKCTRVSGGLNSDARDSCQPYLKQEVELVDPQLIISCGSEAAKSIKEILEYDDELPSQEMDLFNGDMEIDESVVGYRDTEPKWITLSHYSGFGRNLDSIDGFEPDEYDDGKKVEAIYREISKLIKKILKDTV